ncbi:NAD(P)-binding protein [Dichomitus squalens LYAD-421 SS1]|uniref:NAD(P)-binding protein n=1 Tax=Dichomitus squalens (strain LYAD-421) TaxID=732165 RepID=UPI000441402A|nr:NAD(P)-binding protein [Dichomitus squalens LYAD-421 SS1]EJF64808.1 NAD(P)-binding protein [Dichomitus squalens LYAD-421 SS1]
MSTSKTPIFLTGATGYIGGAVLARLLSHPSANTFEITTIVRSAEKAKILKEKFGVNAIVGTHAEHDKIESLAENSHVVFHLADAGDEALLHAILNGLKKRHSKIGDLPILIHTSGTGVLIDDARGEYATDTIHSDINIEQLKSISPTSFHRDVDLAVVDADEKGFARTHIVLPSTIYGIAAHPLAKAGVSNPHSLQIPAITRASLDRKRAGVVGKGLAWWPNVHIDDIAELYIVLFDSSISSPDMTGHGWEGWYYGENGEHHWIDISRAVGKALVELGITDNAEPTSFAVEELPKYFGSEGFGWSFGSNCRCRADRGRALGWKPKYTTQDLLASIKPEVEAFAKKQ